MRLQLEWRTGAMVDRWLDYIVDGRPLSDRFIGHDVSFVTPLGHGTVEGEEQAARRLLGDEPPDVDGRTALYVDSSYGDPQDGAVTVVIRRDADEVTWEDFAFSWPAERDDDGGGGDEWLHEPAGWPALTFPAPAYRAAIAERPRRPLPHDQGARVRRWWQAIRRHR
jgi:hypothetical protein